MKKVLFGVLQPGQQFSLFSDGGNGNRAVRIEPTARKSTVSTPSCRYCGEPAATWVNAKFVKGVVSMHVCPREVVYVDENPLSGDEQPRPEQPAVQPAVTGVGYEPSNWNKERPGLRKNQERRRPGR